MKSLSDIGQVISELEGWEKKYLPDNPQAGKIKLLDIVSDGPLKKVVRWLQWRKYQPEVDEIKAECTKILRWSQTTDGVLSGKDIDDNPFEGGEKRFSLKLTHTLRSIEENIKDSLATEKPAETGKKDEPCDPLSWIYEMYDSLVWKEFRDSGEQWVGPFDPIFRFHEDTESLTDILTLKDCITHLKKILPYWVECQWMFPKSDILADMTHTLRCWLTKVRHDYEEQLPPIPPDLIGMVDWISDVEKMLVGGTTRKEADYTAQEQSSKHILEPVATVSFPEGHREFLIKVASSVHKLIQDQTNRKGFQEQISSFRRLKDNFARALQRAQEAALANPNLRYDYDDVRDKDKDPPLPPVEGYEVEGHHVLNTPPKGFWRPAMPFNPDAWLSRFECNWLGLIDPPAEDPRDRDQMLACEYALLAVIHDEGLDIPACDRLTDSNKDDWVEPLWVGVCQQGVTQDDIGMLPYRQKYIETALNDVNAELAKKQAETEQDEQDKEALRNLAEELKFIINRLAAQPKVQLLEDIKQVRISVAKLGEPDFSFDNISREESIYAEAVVVEYLKERYGEQDDTLGYWPTNWHECPEAYQLYKEKVKEFRTAKVKANIDRLKGLTEKLANIEHEIASVKEPKTRSWNKVSLDFIDDDTIRYKIGESKWKRVNYAEFGFKDKRTGMKRKIWSTFINLAKNCKNGHVIDYKTPKNISKDLDLICDKLRMFFGPKDRPILYNKRNKNWKVTFRLTYKIQDTEISS